MRGAMPPATKTPPVASTMRPRLPAVAPRTEQKIDSAISQTGSVPASARWEMAAAGSCPGAGAASTAAVSGRMRARQAGSSERKVKTSTSPWPDRTRSQDTRPYLVVRNATRPISSGVRAARSTCPPSEGTTW